MTEQQLPKRPVGRPRKKLEDLDPNWRQIMMELAQNGDGPTAWKVYLGLGHDTYNSLLDNYSEFSTTVKEALVLNELFWERAGKDLVTGIAKGNGVVYGLIMSNKFGYNTNRTDSKVVAEVKADVVSTTRNLTDEELKKQLESRGLPTSLLIERD